MKIKTGVKGIAANKGGVAIRFNYFDSSFMVMTCHLTSGQNKIKERFIDSAKCFNGALEHFEKNEKQQSSYLGLCMSEHKK